MKRFFIVTLALILVVCSLAACGGDNGSQGGSADAKEVVLSSLLEDINTQFGLSGLKVLEKASDLSRYYKIDEADVKQFAAEMTTSSTEFCEVIIVEAVDGDAADRVLTQLSNHLDTQINTAKSYSQDQLALVESCSAMQNKNFVFLVISDQASAIVDVIDSATK